MSLLRLLNTSRTTAFHRLAALTRTIHPHPIRNMSSAIPSTMKAVQIAKTGGVDVLEYKTDVPVPQPKEGEVLVKNDFLGVNYSTPLTPPLLLPILTLPVDTYFRTGLYPAPSFPYTLGREGAGTLVALGPGPHPADVSAALGHPVAFLSPGAYAEYTAVPTTYVYPLPASVSPETAAAALLQGLTAITLIDEAHKVHPGDWVLVHAAAGGMGLWLCQLLRARGARTIGTASSPEKRALAQQAGAETVLPYPAALGGDDAFVGEVQKLTGGAGVAVVFDGVGKDTFDASLGAVARKGSMISFGNASGAVAPFVLARLSARNVRLMRPTLFQFVATREEMVRYTKQLVEVLEQGELDVKVHKTYDLKDVVQAHLDLEGRKTTGKLLLKP